MINERELLGPRVLDEYIQSTDDDDLNVTDPEECCLYVPLRLDDDEVLIGTCLLDPLHITLKHDALKVGLRVELLPVLRRHVVVGVQEPLVLLQEDFQSFPWIWTETRNVVGSESVVDSFTDPQRTHDGRSRGAESAMPCEPPLSTASFEGLHL